MAIARTSACFAPTPEKSGLPAYTPELPNAPAEQVAKALYNRGVTKGQLGDSKAAMDDYTRAIELPNAPAEVVEAAREALAKHNCI